MSTSKTILQLGFTFLVGSALFVSGCAKPAAEETAVRESSAPVELAAHATEEVVAGRELVGIWLGSGVLDEQSLTTAMDGLSFETQRQLTAKAETFRATEMAIEFKANGQMVSAVEITSQTGKREAGSGAATWKATPTINPGEYRVSTEETRSTGLKVVDYKTYRVSKNGAQLTLLVDLPGLLGQCNPRIILTRQVEKETIAAGQGSELR